MLRARGAGMIGKDADAVADLHLRQSRTAAGPHGHNTVFLVGPKKHEVVVGLRPGLDAPLGEGEGLAVLLGELAESYRYPAGPIRTLGHTVGCAIGFGAAPSPGHCDDR